MKVITLKYRNISLFDLTRKALFWLDEDSDAVDKVSNFLIFGKYEVTPRLNDNGKLGITFDEFVKEAAAKPRTRLARAVEKVNNFLADNREFIFIDNFDVWSLDDTLQPIIYKSLIKLKDVKHGSPFVDNEDVPAPLRHFGEAGLDKTVHDRWSYVLDEMIYAFSITDEILFSEDSTTETREAISKRADEGRRLFAKYYRGLWD